MRLIQRISRHKGLSTAHPESPPQPSPASGGGQANQNHYFQWLIQKRLVPHHIIGGRGWRILFVLLAVGLAGCGGLSGEPQIVATLPPVIETIELPTTPPDLAMGATIFAERCTRCHGVSGAGDGELIGSGPNQIGNHPRSFQDAATSADQTPLTWYETITNGSIQNMMPPWKDALTAEERWAVALYTYTLHYGQADIQAGRDLMAGTAVAAASLPSLENAVTLTDAELITDVGLPGAFIQSLSEAQRGEVAAYLRSLTVAHAEEMGEITSAPLVTAEPQVTPEVTEQAAVVGTGTVSGTVTNGTAGESLTDDMTANLYVVTSQGALAPVEAHIESDGRFAFANVDLRADQQYVVTTKFKGRAFGSDAKAGDPTTNTLDLPITVYETTDDASVLNISTWELQVQIVGNMLQVINFIKFTNSSDRAYSTNDMVDDKRFAGVQIPVPNGAQILSANVSNSRYTISADGHNVIDIASVIPGETYTFQMVYLLPYQGDLQIEQPVSYTFNGAYILLVNVPNASITSDILKVLGPQDLNGVQYQGYGAAVNLKSGDKITYTIKGGVTPSSTTGTVISADQLVPLLFIFVGLIAILAAGVLYMGKNRALTVRRGNDDPNDVLVDGLIQQIAEVDEAYNTGKLDEATYIKRRERLKARLATLIDEG